MQSTVSGLGLVFTLMALYISPKWYMWAFALTHIGLIWVFRRLAKPKTAKKNLETVTRLDKVAHLLQLESQGSLLLQVADILLGALHFEERQKEMGLTSGKEAKVKLVKMVKTLLAKKITAIECLHAVESSVTNIIPAVKTRDNGEYSCAVQCTADILFIVNILVIVDEVIGGYYVD